MYFGDDVTCNYVANNSVSGQLTSPIIEGVTAGSELSFDYYRVVESFNGRYDITQVEVLVGANATVVFDLDARDASTAVWVNSGPISLAAFAGQDIRLRFSFDSIDDFANNFTGWLIDDIVVTPGDLCASNPNCDDNNPCTTDSCEPATGCVNAPVADGTACADADLCNGQEVCTAGVCGAGTPLNCDDGNACTSDSCDPATGCASSDVPDGTACADGDVCNGDEVCAQGVCNAGTPPVCDDGNVCTTDSCDPVAGCVAADSPDGTACADSDVCNGAETCIAGACTGGTALNCDDQNPCTANTCDPVTGCAANPVTDGTSCGDGNVCNGAEVCTAGTCVAGTPLVCDDGNRCTADLCDAVAGCTNPPVVDGTPCADGTVCNGAETCQAGTCTSGTPPNCDDGSVCTIDSCDAVNGCFATPVADGSSCADGTVCNGDETCVAGACTAGAPPNCDDGNPCTADACDAITGCTTSTVADGTACDDDTVCNGSESCVAGVCAPGTPLNCDDGNECTTDGCDAAAGCAFDPVPDGNPCLDDTVCNGAETCQAGVCSAGTPLVCTPPTICEAATCDPTLGCQLGIVPDGTSCDDGDICDGQDVCMSGICESRGTPCGPGTEVLNGECVASTVFTIRFARSHVPQTNNAHSVFVTGTNRDGSPALGEVIIGLSRPDAGTLSQFVLQVGPLGAETTYTTCGTLQCAGPFHFTLALSSDPTTIVARSADVVIAPIGNPFGISLASGTIERNSGVFDVARPGDLIVEQDASGVASVGILEMSSGLITGFVLASAGVDVYVGEVTGAATYDVVAYSGDGTLTVADATAGGSVVGTLQPSSLGVASLTVDPAVLSQILQSFNRISFRIEPRGEGTLTIAADPANWGLGTQMPQLRLTNF